MSKITLYDGSGNPVDLTGDTLNELLGGARQWVDVTTSRTFDVIYTNDTGKEIEVSIVFGQGTGAYHTVSLFVNGNMVAHQTNTNADSGKEAFVSVTVPNGSTYMATATIGSQIISWHELRV